jgi:hypothetical protein
LTLANRDRDTETDRVVRAVLGQNDALQRLDYADFRANTCARDAGTEAQVLDRQRTSVAAKGGRYVGNVTDVSMSGDTASATVTYYFERNRDDKTDVRTALVREDGAWGLHGRTQLIPAEPGPSPPVWETQIRELCR